MNVTPTSNTPQITAKEKKRVRQITSINVINIVKFELLLNPLVTTIFYFIYEIQLPGFKNYDCHLQIPQMLALKDIDFFCEYRSAASITII